jgi:hypothetical protein
MYRMTDLNKNIDSLPPWMEKLVDRSIHMLQNDTLKKKIQILVLQPFLQYFIELLFPYVIITCVVFGLLIILLISILALLVFKTSSSVAKNMQECV